jgi:hypothetical protein
MKTIEELIQIENIETPQQINEAALYDEAIARLQEAKENGTPIDEGLFGAIFGGLSGAVAGPAIGRGICKALGLDERGMLGNLLTSRLFLTALGGYIGWKA